MTDWRSRGPYVRISVPLSGVVQHSDSSFADGKVAKALHSKVCDAAPGYSESGDFSPCKRSNSAKHEADFLMTQPQLALVAIAILRRCP